MTTDADILHVILDALAPEQDLIAADIFHVILDALTSLEDDLSDKSHQPWLGYDTVDTYARAARIATGDGYRAALAAAKAWATKVMDDDTLDAVFIAGGAT